MTEKKSDMWMPLYVGDYLAATTRLTTEQHGAYLLLMLDYWKSGPPPNDDAVLAQIARLSPSSWKRARAALIGFFDVKDGKLVQKRIEKERNRAASIVEKRRKAGKASAAARASASEATHVATHVEQEGQQTTEQTSRPSQSHISVDKSTGGEPPANGSGDIVKDVFDVGVSILVNSGVSEKQARSFLGKLRKTTSDADVLVALMECRAKLVSDPIEWLTKRLKPAAFVSKSGYRYKGDLESIIRESERRADWNTHWAAKTALKEQEGVKH